MKSKVYFPECLLPIVFFKGNVQILTYPYRENSMQRVYTVHSFLCNLFFHLHKSANIIYTMLHLAFFTSHIMKIYPYVY